MALADPIQILLILSVIPVSIILVLWLVYNHGKRVGRLEAHTAKS
jgi:hypothetical protein